MTAFDDFTDTNPDNLNILITSLFGKYSSKSFFYINGKTGVPICFFKTNE